MKGKFLCWGLAAVALVSCSKAETTTRKAKLTPPRDEASSEQRAAIDETLSQIEQLTADLGQPHSFRELPVVLTTDDHTYTNHPAACVFEKGGDPQFILVKPSVLEAEASLQYDGNDSTLFRVLLHEIGHCYFGRKHEDSRLFLDGKSFAVPQGQTYAMLDATVMVPENLSLPVALERYYVGEMLGLFRASTAEELTRLSPVKLVRSSELVVRP